MSWFWAYQEQEVFPGNSGICGGDQITADLFSVCSVSTTVEPSISFSVSILTDCDTEFTIDISGHGLRDALSLSRNFSELDIDNGLQVYNEARLLSANTNIIRFYGQDVGANNTLSQRQDISIMSPPYGGILSGGDSDNSGLETLYGGSSGKPESELDGGDATV